MEGHIRLFTVSDSLPTSLRHGVDLSRCVQPQEMTPMEDTLLKLLKDDVAPAAAKAATITPDKSNRH